MSDLMLLGVLRMPMECWSDDGLDQMQRHGRYLQAADRIESDEAELARKDAEIAGLREELEATRKAAKRGMDAAIAGSASRLRTAIAIEASTHPEMVESEREANARLTGELEGAEAELARLQKRYADSESKLAFCDAALQELQAELARLRAQTESRAAGLEEGK